jgi:CDP-diglyceride synthetase
METSKVQHSVIFTSPLRKLQNMILLDSIPLWLLVVSVALSVWVAIELGYRVGRTRAGHPIHEAEAPVGTIVGAILGLLAFFLAFTFSLAATQFEARREMVVEEANAIGTTFLRAGFLPCSQATEVRRLLDKYVDVRLDVIKERDLEKVISLSDDLHRQLWSEAENAGNLQNDSVTVGLFVESLNALIDVHSKRIQIGLRNRLPPLLWGVLFLLTFFAMAGVGYQKGLFKSLRSPATFIMIVCFSIIIGLIADLDTPQDGFLVVSQEAILKLQEYIRATP